MIQYILVGFQREYNVICLNDFIQKENVLIYKNTSPKAIFYKMQKIHCSGYVNRYINIPFKNIWFNTYKKLSEEGKKVFIFSASQIWLFRYKNGLYIQKLRECHPDCVIICYFWDLISSLYNFDIYFFKGIFDYIFTYDLGEAKKFGLIYCPVPYSKIDIEEDSLIAKMDIYFCGAAKNRLKELYEIYDYLEARNLICHFRITNVPKNKMIKREGIVYNKPISYYRNLQYVQKTKCLLDVIQKNSTGETLRVKEAITYGKKLLTNNEEIKNRDFYHPNQISIYSNLNDIDLDFLNQENPETKEVQFSDFEGILRALMENK